MSLESENLQDDLDLTYDVTSSGAFELCSDRDDLPR